jgi:hypothetical protein
MIVVGASIRVYTPSIQSVIVCSNDSDLKELRSVLEFQGLQVAWVRRHKQAITLAQSRTKEIHTFQILKPIEAPSQESGIDFLKQVLLKNSDEIYELGRLSKAFFDEFGISLTDFLKSHKLGNAPKLFLQKQADFCIFKQENSNHIYVRLQPTPPISAVNSSDNSTELNTFTERRLKSIMLGIIDHLLKKKESEKILLSTVASTFKQQYGQSIASVLKALTIAVRKLMQYAYLYCSGTLHASPLPRFTSPHRHPLRTR